MNSPSNNSLSQANEGVKVSRLNFRQEDTEGKNELQLITVTVKRGMRGVGCGSLSFLLSLSATVGDLKASITRATGLETEDQELIFCGQFLRDSLSTLGNALQLQSAMRHNPAIVHLHHRRRQSVSSSSQNTDFFAGHNSLPVPRNQDQDTQEQGSMLQEPCEHDFSHQAHWDMHSRVSHTGAPEVDTLELLYREQHMILSQMYGSPVMHPTLLSKLHQQPQSLSDDKAMPANSHDSGASISSSDWIYALLNTPSHGAGGDSAAQNENGANGAYHVGLGEEETAAIVLEEAESGGERYNVNDPTPTNRLLRLQNIRIVLKIAALVFIMVQEGHRLACCFLLFCVLGFYLFQSDVLHKMWTMVRRWYSNRRPLRRRERVGQEVNSPDTIPTPVQPGVISDMICLLRSLVFSLLPGWEPVPNNQPNVQ